LVTLADTTIPIVTNDGPLTAVCGRCRADQPVPALGPCQQCGRPVEPRTRKVRPAAARRGDGEAPFDSAAGTQQVVAVVEVVAALILSHSCDVDTKDQIRFAPVRPLADRRFERLRPGIQARTGHYAYFYLPTSDRLPEAAACLNEVFSLPRAHVGERRRFTSQARQREESVLAPYVQIVDSRRASLDDEGLSLLYQAQVTLDVRPEVVEFDFAPSPATFEDDPDRPQRADLPTANWTWPTPHWLR
jgi:hypothetical protein